MQGSDSLCSQPQDALPTSECETHSKSLRGDSSKRPPGAAPASLVLHARQNERILRRCPRIFGGDAGRLDRCQPISGETFAAVKRFDSG